MSRTASDGLGASASRGAAVTIVGQGVRIGLMLTGVVVLSRLLDPQDYGLLTMVLAIIGIGEILRDFGLSSAAMQARTITNGQRSNLFWISTGIGALLSVVVIACAPLISAFYDESKLTLIAMCLASTFLLNGLMTQYKADLARNLRFARLTGIEIIGQATGLVLAILLAIAGWGYWALVVQQISQLVVQLVLVLVVTRWVPRWYSRSEPMRGFLTFGANLVGVQLLGYASSNVDSIVIGSTFGAGPLGLYNRAYQLLVLPLNQINAPMTRVVLPVLARLQDDPARYRRYLLTGQTVMLNVVSAVLALCAAQSTSIVLIALGPRWLESASIFQVLSIAGFFTMAGYACHWVFLSKGLTNQALKVSLITRPLMIALIVVGAFWGLYGVAWAYAIGIALQWPISLYAIHRVSDAPVRSILLNGVRTILVYGAATVVSRFSTAWLVEGVPPIAKLAIGAGALLGSLAVTALIIPAYRRDLATVITILRRMVKRRDRRHKGEQSGQPEMPDTPLSEP